MDLVKDKDLAEKEAKESNAKLTNEYSVIDHLQILFEKNKKEIINLNEEIVAAKAKLVDLQK